MAASECEKLSNRQIVQLAASISLSAMKSIAQGYLDISSEIIKSKEMIHKHDYHAFNRDMIELWANENSDDQIKKLAILLHKASRDLGEVNPSKIQEILCVSCQNIAESSNNSHEVTVEKEEVSALADKIRPHCQERMKIDMPPWIKDSSKPMERYFVDLILKTEDMSNENNSRLLEHYKDLLKQDSNQVNKILLKGDPGIGKSTLSKKITWDWATGNLNTFEIVFLIFPKSAKKGVTIESILMNQHPFLQEFRISEEKLKIILKKFGENCLLIFDGFNQASMANNNDVKLIIQGHKFTNCNVLVTCRPHSARKFSRYFTRIAVVEGFAREKAAKFAGMILRNSQSVDTILNFEPIEFREEEKERFSPILLSILCFLSKTNEIDASCKTMFSGEIYTRMIRCLYKTYTVRNKEDYDQKNFEIFLISLGKLAFKNLATKTYLFRKKEIIQQINEHVFDYGIICGYEDARRLTDETADICVTYIHSSLEEFLGAFYFVWALCEGENIDNLFGLDCKDPVCLINPLFLHFALWFLYSDQKYFTFPDKEQVQDGLEKYCSERIASFEMFLPKIVQSYPAIDVETACKRNDQLSLNFFKRIFQQSPGMKTLVANSTDTMPWILTTVCPLLTSVNSITIDRACSVASFKESELVLRVETLEDGSLDPIFKYWKQLEMYFSVHLYTERDNVDLSVLLTYLKQDNLRKLQIGAHHHCSGLVMTEMLWHCYNLTHLSINNQQIHENTLITTCRAVQGVNLPYLSHLGLVKCRGLNEKLNLLFRSPWPQLIHLNLYGSPLSDSDYNTLSEAIDGENVFPRLVLLVVSFTTISRQTFPHVTNITNEHRGLQSLFLDALTVERSVQIVDAVQLRGKPPFKSFGVSLRWNILPNRLDTNRHFTLASLGSLTLHSCIGNHDDLTTMIRQTSLRRLSHLDISHSLKITGKCSALFLCRFPSLSTLILSNCGLNSDDLYSLSHASFQGKLPKLQHLDVSRNHSIDRCLVNLFPRVIVKNKLPWQHSVVPQSQDIYKMSASQFPRFYTWEGLLSLNLTETMKQEEQIDFYLGCNCMPSLQEFMVSMYPQEKVTAKWSNLQKLCISECDDNMLTNIADAVTSGMFPVLESVCIKRMSSRPYVSSRDLHYSESYYKLTKAKVACHLEVLSEQPFTPSKCVCAISRKNKKWSVPWGIKSLVLAAGLMFPNLNHEKLADLWWHN